MNLPDFSVKKPKHGPRALPVPEPNEQEEGNLGVANPSISCYITAAGQALCLAGMGHGKSTLAGFRNIRKESVTTQKHHMRLLMLLVGAKGMADIAVGVTLFIGESLKTQWKYTTTTECTAHGNTLGDIADAHDSFIVLPSDKDSVSLSVMIADWRKQCDASTLEVPLKAHNCDECESVPVTQTRVLRYKTPPAVVVFLRSNVYSAGAHHPPDLDGSSLAVGGEGHYSFVSVVYYGSNGITSSKCGHYVACSRNGVLFDDATVRTLSDSERKSIDDEGVLPPNMCDPGLDKLVPYVYRPIMWVYKRQVNFSS